MKEKPEILYEDAAEHRTNLTGWVCKNCNRYWGTREDMARYCCATTLPCKCGERMRKGYTRCDKCSAKANAERDQKLLDNAKTVEYDGPFMLGDTYYHDIEDYLEDCEGNDIEPVEFAFVPGTHTVFSLDIDDLINYAIEEAQSDDSLDLEPSGYDALKSAISSFNKLNEDVLVYFESTNKKFKVKE